MTQRLRLGEILVQAGILTDEQLARALDAQAGADGVRHRLGSVITRLGFANETEIATAIARQLGVPFLDVSDLTPDPELVSLIPRRIAEHHQAIPVGRNDDGVITVALADPTNVVALDDLGMILGRRIELAVATAAAIGERIERWYGIGGGANEAVLWIGDASAVEVLPDFQMDEDLESVRRSTEMAPIVRLVNALLSDATKSRATDVHIEPYPREVQVRFRIDGHLREVMTLPKYVHLSTISRIKVMNGMDIAERRRPQDGRGRVLVDGQEVDVRVSTLPTMHGEKVVLRLLRKDEAQVDFAVLGMADDELAAMQRLLAMPQGLIVFTGPTGSGKTTSMYAAMRQLVDPSRNVVTLEDPIEYQINGVNQVQIDDRIGLSFARGLRTILRQDPNIILVGEIRDAETAQIAMQAALTGHLVMTTLHTNDAPSAITRLVDIGVEPFLISSALSAVVAQRLLRTVCTECTQRADPSERTLAMLGLTRGDLIEHTIVQGAGCPTCAFTGYLGRAGIFEILTMTTRVREQIIAGASEAGLARVAREEGLRTLRQTGLARAFEGRTTLDEVLRATYFEREDTYRCPGCRHEVERSFASCPYCQTPLAGGHCGSCSRPTKPEWHACPWCSASLTPSSPFADGVPRVLLVDDDPELCAMLKTLLSPEFDVTTAGTAEEALRRAPVDRPDLILLDLLLPDQSGTAVAEALRAQVATASIPIVMLTGEADEDAEIRALQAGADDFLRKPVEEDVLRARLSALLRRSVRA
ncbi:MAG TPA: ATPase, T2SS/T4P/T4SS family [Actinomycetota bacterium]